MGQKMNKVDGFEDVYGMILLRSIEKLEQKRKEERKMKFMEAVKEMEKGKKIGRKLWPKNTLIYLKGRTFYYEENLPKNISLDDIYANDWEIVEEKKTLADTIFTQANGQKAVHVCCLNEALKEYFNSLPPNSIDLNRAREIFGEELLS